MSKLVVVTATADAERFHGFATELTRHARNARVPVIAVQQRSYEWLRIPAGVVEHHADYLGVVPAFARGVEVALRTYPEAEVIACLHDDVLLEEPGWDEQILAHFQAFPECGLAGFGGAWGLGDEQAGQGEYRPTWLVRRGFMSNMRDAEVHGARVLESRRVAVLDGFSLIFRRDFLQTGAYAGVTLPHPGDNLFTVLQRWGVVHHAYDAAMGALARDLGWETWLLPFACHHLGGQTAVGDSRYAEWARKQTATGEGDQRFWEEAHGIVWAKLGHLLPFEVDRP